MTVSAVTVIVVFAPPAKDVFPQHPECSVAGFSPDLTQKQRAFCREWNKK
jgi:hypothetical protein